MFGETSWARDRMATTVFMHSTQRQGVAEEGRFEVSPQSPLPLECLSEKHLDNNTMRESREHVHISYRNIALVTQACATLSQHSVFDDGSSQLPHSAVVVKAV